MAAVLAAVGGDVLDTLLGGSITGIVSRGIVGGLIGFAVSKIISYFTAHPEAKSHPNASKIHYAIVDLHNDTTIRLLSAGAVYRFLTRRRRRIGRNRGRAVVVPQGATLELVK